MIKALYKKFKGVFQDVIGTATVVCPEVVINKKWNPNSQYVGDSLRVPSANFYDYLGHTVVPDEGLKSPSEGGLGLGLGPYNNDLAHAVDKDTFSSPGPIAMNTEYIETGVRVGGTPGTQRKKYTNIGRTGGSTLADWLKPWSHSWPHHIPNAESVRDDYTWEGTWGDLDNKFQTSATFQVELDYDVQKTGGGVFYMNIEMPGTLGAIIGNLVIGPSKADTSALAFNVICGSVNDETTENVKLYYEGGSSAQDKGANITNANPASAPNQITVSNAYTFFNPHYSSGNYFFRDDDIGKQIHTFTVYRKPFEEKIRFYTSYAGEAGEYQPFPVEQFATNIANLIVPQFIRDIFNLFSAGINNLISAINSIVSTVNNVVKYLSLGLGPTIPELNKVDKLGDAIRDVFKLAFIVVFSLLNFLLYFITGQDALIPAYFKVDIKEIYREETTIDQEEFAKTKMGKRWNTINKKSYLFSQMYYPYIFENPIFPYAYSFSYREPFFKNAVVKNNFYNDSFRSNNPYTKLNKYFVPSAFSLLYETNLGVFYEQLVKLHITEAKSKIKPDFNLNIKLEDYNVPVDFWVFTNQQEKCVYDLILPTNLDFADNLLLEYANNTGYLNSTEATGATTGLIVSGATAHDSKQSATLPSEYASVYSDYPFLNGFKSSVAGINTVIGNFTDLNAKIDSLGYDLELWTELCNTNSSEFQTLSSGSPKNLSYKLVEYILWYIEPQGIIEQTRQSVQALIGYEKLLNDDINEYRKSADGSEYEKYHIVGTDIYERNCPPS